MMRRLPNGLASLALAAGAIFGLTSCPASKPSATASPSESQPGFIKPSPLIDGRPESQQTPPFVSPSSLLRPLTLPRLRAGQPCPITTKRTITIDGQPDEGVLGRGPAYIYVLDVSRDRRGVFHLDGARKVGSWLILEGTWWVRPGETDPILIRARRLDGEGQMLIAGWGPPRGAVVQLDDGQEIASFAAGRFLTQTQSAVFSPSGWTNYPPAYIAIKSPGCYGLQVDGVSFSYSIVMKIAP